MTMTKEELELKRYRITKEEDYEPYITALCHLASTYVSKIRVQFAEKAMTMYENETVRKVVLAYGKEVEELNRHRLFDFKFHARYKADDAFDPDALNDYCLSNAQHYKATIAFLFGIVW